MIKAIFGLIIGLVVISVVLAFPVGYIMNAVKFARLDFKQPIKAEIVRGIGIVSGPIGSIMGFVKIEDN